MRQEGNRQTGFTLIEVAIVLMIVTILLGFTMAIFPKQQELRQYKEADREMDNIINTIIGFAQVNGRLPCPSAAASAGVASGGGEVNCTTYGGMVPSVTLGISGRLNADNLLSDPWGNPYRYYASNGDANDDGLSDFVVNAQMREIGLGDVFNASVSPALDGPDGYIDLDGQYMICDASDGTADDECGGTSTEVFGNRDGAGGPYAGAPFVLLSLGKNGNQTPTGDELENRGNTNDWGYFVKNVVGGQTTFVKRPTGFADDFDDIVRWVSPGMLYSRMIEAYQLP